MAASSLAAPPPIDRADPAGFGRLLRPGALTPRRFPPLDTHPARPMPARVNGLAGSLPPDFPAHG